MKQLVKAAFRLRRIRNGIGTLFFCSREMLFGLSLVGKNLNFTRQKQNNISGMESESNVELLKN